MAIVVVSRQYERKGSQSNYKQNLTKKKEMNDPDGP